MVLGPREVRADDIQEKMGVVPHSQAQGTEQISWVEVPDTRVGKTWKLGVSLRAGQREIVTQDMVENHYVCDSTSRQPLHLV